MTTLKELRDLIDWLPEQMWPEARQILLEHPANTTPQC